MEPENILVVDDEDYIREMVIDVLQEQGYESAGARDYDSAIALLSDSHFDLLILDIMMPGRSGIELFQYVIENEIDSGVVFMTARRDTDIAVNTIKSGALDYIVKPVDINRLDDIVRSALEKRSALKASVDYRSELEQKVEKHTHARE